MAENYPSDFNPREELKSKSERYAQMIYYGLPLSKLKEFDPIPDDAQEKMASTWAGKPLWELWCMGKLYQFYIMQWAIQKSENPQLVAVVKFMLRLSGLADISGSAMEAVYDGLGADLKAAGGPEEAALAAAKSGIKALHASTRLSPYDVGAFTSAMSGLLAAVPNAQVDSNTYFADKDFGLHLARATDIMAKPKHQENFNKAAKPLLIGVGGYGLVTLCFDDQWGIPVALKRQNISMVVDKKHADRALLELKIASTMTSPFIVGCPYAFVDGKDLVLALAMLPGGDLAHYLKIAKEAAKKKKLPKTGLEHKAAQFYLASTILGLEVLHSNGFVYRDLKDKNVLLDATGRAKLCDFGLVHDLKLGPAKGKVGTKGFWAPEQIDKHKEYDTTADLWTLGVCAYHWSSATIPFNVPDDPDATNALTCEAKYDKEEPHLTQSKSKESSSYFRPGLKSLCEALLQIDTKARLGSKETGGFPALMQHEFFKGFDWNALNGGTLAPPLVPPSNDINADLPRELKDEFGAWAKKPVPDDALETFKVWGECNPNMAVLENNAIELLDKNPVFFEASEVRNQFDMDPEGVKKSALLRAGLWSGTIKPPPMSNSAPPPSGGGGCCALM